MTDELLELLVDGNNCIIRFPGSVDLLGNIPAYPGEEGFIACWPLFEVLLLGPEVDLGAVRGVDGFLLFWQFFGHKVGRSQVDF